MQIRSPAQECMKYMEHFLGAQECYYHGSLLEMGEDTFVWNFYNWIFCFTKKSVQKYMIIKYNAGLSFYVAVVD